MKAALRTADDFERRLAAEGLGPVTDSEASRRIAVTEGAKHASESATAVDAWMAWAANVLDTHRFASRRQRRYWALFAGGMSLVGIADKLKVTHAAAYLAIRSVRRKVAAPPVENPWRKSNRYRGEVVDINAVKRELEAHMAAGTQGRRPVTYTRILLREEIEVPGISVRKDRLMNVEGLPHAGGIDVTIDGQRDGKKVPMVITVPWFRIRQADRAATEE